MTDRCSAASQARAESQIGTASRVDTFLLLECPGPWGREALRDGRLPDRVKRRLRALDGSDVKALLVRREEPVEAGTRLFVCRDGRTRTALLDDPAELLDLDLPAEAALTGDTDLDEHPDPLYLVCTHGRHDVCCAERGRPLWKAAHAAAPEHTWQSSHLGGDRFAGNLLVLPSGLYYGRVAPESVAGIVAGHRRGELDLTHLRGRSSLPYAVQAAEILLRRHLDLVDERPLRLVSHRRGVVELEHDARRWRVHLDVSTAPPTRLTCRAAGVVAAPRFDLVAIDDNR